MRQTHALLGRGAVGFWLIAALLFAQHSIAEPHTTIITHGFSPGSKGDWVQSMAENIRERSSAGFPTIYRYNGETGAWSQVVGGGGVPDRRVLIFNWVAESDAITAADNWRYAEGAGDALYAALRYPRGALAGVNLLTGTQLHFIGHSRGASVNSEAVRRLAIAGFTVDQVTTLDPHPVNGRFTVDPFNYNWGDPVPQTWSNVLWADNYYRTDIDIPPFFDFDGMPISGAAERRLSESVLFGDGYASEHSDVHLWYHGTIDSALPICDSDACFDQGMLDTWYSPAKGPTAVGFLFSRLGGGASQRNQLPSGFYSGTGFAPRFTAPATELPFNGTFDNGGYGSSAESYAGWRFHGGAGRPELVTEGGNTFARIGCQPLSGGSDYWFLTHNRFFLPNGSVSLQYRYRVWDPDSDERLLVTLTEVGGAFYDYPSISLASTTGWLQQVIEIPPQLSRNVAYTLKFEIINRGALVESEVDIDNVAIVQQISDDRFENNDSSSTASNLGTPSSTRIEANLTMNDGADWYRFATTQTGNSISSVRIDFNNAQGNLALCVYRGAGLAQVGCSDGSANSEQVSLSGQPGDTYYVKVSGSSNPAYTLTVSPPTGTQPGSHLSVSSQKWSDPDGDGDGVPEGGEGVSLRVRLRNNGSSPAIGVEGALLAQGGSVTVTDDYSDWGTINPGSVVLPTDDFNMVLGFASADDYPFALFATYSLNGVNYSQTLQFTKDFLPQGDHSAFQVCSVTIDDSDHGNGDGVLQSGEGADLTLSLQNIGEATAIDPDVSLVLQQGCTIEVPMDIDRFLDLLAGGGCAGPELAGNTLAVRNIPRSFAGTCCLDVQIFYDGASTTATIPCGVQLNIAAIPWICVSPDDYDFGIVGTQSPISVPVSVNNSGSAPLMVTAVTPSHPDTAWTGPATFTVQPGQSLAASVSINPAMLNGQQIMRTVSFVSNGQVDNESCKQIVVTGLVSNAAPVYRLPTTTAIDNGPDVSGNVIVWPDTRNGGYDIYGYDLATGQEFPVATGPSNQGRPRIGGTLVAWREIDPTTMQYSLWARDLAGGTAFQISTLSQRDYLIGVDSGLVAFTREYRSFVGGPEPSEVGTLYNFWIYNYSNPAYPPGALINLTGFTSNNSHQPMDTVYFDYASLDGGWLVWSEVRITYTGSYWDSSLRPVRKFTVGVDPAPVQILSPGKYVRDADTGTFIWLSSDAQGDDQVWRWIGGGVSQITPSGSQQKSDPVISGNLVVYEKDVPGGEEALVYWDLATGQEHLITVEQPGYCLCSPFRMDGNLLVWWSPPSSVAYSFLNTSDLAVASADVSVSDNPVEESQPFNMTATVRNLGSFVTASSIVARLFDGNPNSGGVQLGSDQTVPGGLAAHGQAVVAFNNVMLTADGPHTLYVKVFPPVGDNPANNTGFRVVDVTDSDTQGPSIVGLTVSDLNGDGDGVPGTDEMVSIAWELSDASGIGAVEMSVDGLPVTVTSLPTGYRAILGPLADGVHSYSITASDADNSPETTILIDEFTVVRSEEITILFSGAVLTDDAPTPVALGAMATAGSTSTRTFQIRNDGDQTLFLSGTTASPPGMLITGPGSMDVAGGTVVTFSVSPGSLPIGSFTALIQIASSDVGSSRVDLQACKLEYSIVSPK